MRSSDIIESIDTATERERPGSPETAQKTKAVRYPGNEIKIKNTTESAFGAFSYVKLTEFYPNDNYYDGELPDSLELGLTPLSSGQLAIVESEIPPGKIGIGYKGGVHKVEIYSEAENIAVGDPVGSKDGSGKAMHGGPHRAVATETEDSKIYVYVEQND